MITKTEQRLRNAYEGDDERVTARAIRAYVNAVARRERASDCEYGHSDCALSHEGLCSNEAAAEHFEITEQLWQR